MIELLVTDLDGTLWQGDGVVAPSTMRAVGELGRRGIPVLAATARRSWVTARFFDRAGLDIPAVLLNGALGRTAGARELFFDQPFSADNSAAVLEILGRHHIVPCAYFETDDLDLVSGPNPSACKAYLDTNKTRLTRLPDLLAVCSAQPPYCFSVVGSERAARLAQVADELRTAGLATVMCGPDVRLGGFTLDVAPIPLDKWSGVTTFCARLGIDSANVLAIGDGDNDVELLKHAKVSVAMGHATQAALAAADVVLPAGPDTWADVLEYI